MIQNAFEHTGIIGLLLCPFSKVHLLGYFTFYSQGRFSLFDSLSRECSKHGASLCCRINHLQPTCSINQTGEIDYYYHYYCCHYWLRWMNGRRREHVGDQRGDLIAEQRGLCAAFNPSCTPLSASQLLYLCLHSQAGSPNYFRRPISTIARNNNGVNFPVKTHSISDVHWNFFSFLFRLYGTWTWQRPWWTSNDKVFVCVCVFIFATINMWAPQRSLRGFGVSMFSMDIQVAWKESKTCANYDVEKNRIK